MNTLKKVFIAASLITCLHPILLKSQINWTNHAGNPVIGGDFDPEAQSIQRPCVLFDGGTYHMWYASVRVYLISGISMKLNCMGYATSPDGISWQSVKPAALEPSLDGNAFDQLHAGQGWVIADHDTFKMWYWGYNPSVGETGLNTIGYAWSLDGSNWNRVAGPGALGSVYDLEMAGLPDSMGLATPCVVKAGDTYHMWHSQVVIAPFLFRIGYARSPDGIRWTKVDGAGLNGSVVDWGPPGSFDQLSVSWPAVIGTDEGFMMWYYGHNGTRSRIGCSLSTDGMQWNRAPGLDESEGCLENALGACVIPMNSQYQMWYSPENSDLVNLAFSDRNTDVGRPDDPACPSAFSLERNFPNPFNPSTTIAYTVQEPGLVHLAVYDLAGRRVKELIHAFQQPGLYSMTADLQEIPSGIYLYKIQMGDFQAAGKMVKLD